MFFPPDAVQGSDGTFAPTGKFWIGFLLAVGAGPRKSADHVVCLSSRQNPSAVPLSHPEAVLLSQRLHDLLDGIAHNVNGWVASVISNGQDNLQFRPYQSNGIPIELATVVSHSTKIVRTQ